jgi:hypothetical protein
MTEREIQAALWLRNHQRFCVLMPNDTPRGWWECDLFGVTKAGYFHEFEVKLTVADYRKDAKKHSGFTWVRGENGMMEKRTGQSKHSKIGQSVGPSRFWYVVPDGLLQGEAVPEWAGLQTLRLHDDGYGSKRVYCRTVKQAPQLHRVKIDDQIIRHAMGVCYYRYWHERDALDRFRRDELSRRETAQ